MRAPDSQVPAAGVVWWWGKPGVNVAGLWSCDRATFTIWDGRGRHLAETTGLYPMLDGVGEVTHEFLFPGCDSAHPSGT